MSTARRKKQAEEADNLIRQMAQQNAGEPDEQPPADPPQEPAAEDDQDPAAQPAVHDQGAAPQDEPPRHEDEPATRSEEDDPAYWKQRYKSLDGIIRQRDNKIDQLSDIIANMQHSVAQMQAQQSAPAAPAEEAPVVSKEDETAFGPDLIDLIRRVFAQESRELESRLKKEFSGLESRMTQTESSVKETAQERFERYLDKNAEGWRDSDSDPGFMEWLKASRVRYQQFTASVQHTDHVAVADIFNMYKDLVAADESRREAEEAARNAPKQQRQQQLEKQLAPGKSKQVGQDHRQADEPKQWTSSEITRTYANRKSFSAQKWAEMEREIADAQREGRVDFSR